MAKGNKVAIQNFSGGGFYGKLGVHVGQRLYDRFILRTYVKTPNPKTPNQMRVRGDFSRTSKRASFSLNLNPRTPQISTQTMPAIAARNKVAIALEKSGAADLDLLPLFELERQPNFLLNKIALVRQDNARAYFQISGNLPLVSRNISAVFILDDEDFELENCQITSGAYVLSGADYNLYLEKPSIWTFDDKTRIVLISNDDAQNQNTFVWLPCSYIDPAPLPERNFDFTISAFTRNGNIFEIVFNETYITGAQNFENFVLHCVSDGSFGDFSIESPTMTDKNGKFAIQFSSPNSNEFEIWAFPSGSKFTISNLVIYGDEIILKAQNAEVSLTSSDLTRTKTTQIDAQYCEFNGNDEQTFIEIESVSIPFAIANANAQYDSEAETYKTAQNIEFPESLPIRDFFISQERNTDGIFGIIEGKLSFTNYDPTNSTLTPILGQSVVLENGGLVDGSDWIAVSGANRYFFVKLPCQNVIYRIKIDCPQNTRIPMV